MKIIEVTGTSVNRLLANSGTLTADPRGPQLLQDISDLGYGKLAHFDREAIPERRMHANSERYWVKFHLDR